jgi:hypothetical protein
MPRDAHDHLVARTHTQIGLRGLAVPANQLLSSNAQPAAGLSTASSGVQPAAPALMIPVISPMVLAKVDAQEPPAPPKET